MASYVPIGEVHAGLLRAAGFPARTSVSHAASALGSGVRLPAQDTVPSALWSATGHLDDLPVAL